MKQQLWQKPLIFPLLIGASLIVAPSSVDARWAGPKDAPTSTEDEQVDIEVAKDHTWKETQVVRLRILNEEGRKKDSVQRLTYNSRASRLQVLEAWTEVQGRKVPVETHDIQDKPLASSREGFDQLNQLTIAFPAVEEDALLHLKTLRETREVPFEGFYSANFMAGLWSWDKKATIHIQAPFRLHTEEHDPEDYLDVKTSREGTGTRIRIRLKKEAHFRMADEENLHIEGTRLPRVTVSSSEHWSDMVQVLAPGWEKVLQSPLPKLHQSIAEGARKEKSPTRMLDRVTSQLASKVRYWADWRPIRGGHIPRNLETIARTGFGDCKDFSASTIAILRTLGFEARPAFIQRSTRPILREGKLPYGGDFNHAIVHATREGITYWIDPTNTTSFSEGIFEDIIDRPALVIDGKSTPATAQLLRTTAGTPESSVQKLSLQLETRKDGTRLTRGRLLAEGRSATRWAGDGLEKSKDTIEYQLISSLANNSQLLDWDVDLPDLKDRIVRSLKFGFEFSEKGDDLKTSAGPAIQLRQGATISALLTRTDDRASDLWLGWPITVEREQTLKKAALVGNTPLSCTLASRWADIKRDVLPADESHEIQIRDRIALKLPLVRQAEYKVAEWKEFQGKLRECFDRVAVVYKESD